MAQASIVTSLFFGGPVTVVLVNRHVDAQIDEAHRENVRRFQEITDHLRENHARLEQINVALGHSRETLNEIHEHLRRAQDGERRR